jgi:hypothetical protein
MLSLNHDKKFGCDLTHKILKGLYTAQALRFFALVAAFYALQELPFFHEKV